MPFSVNILDGLCLDGFYSYFIPIADQDMVSP